MLSTTNPPTDNLYKFTAIAGLLMVFFAVFLFEKRGVRKSQHLAIQAKSYRPEDASKTALDISILSMDVAYGLYVQRWHDFADEIDVPKPLKMLDATKIGDSIDIDRMDTLHELLIENRSQYVANNKYHYKMVDALRSSEQKDSESKILELGKLLDKCRTAAEEMVRSFNKYFVETQAAVAMRTELGLSLIHI